MNVKKLAIVITVILVVVLGATIMFTLGGEEGDDGISPSPFDSDGMILSDTPPGVTENSDNKLEIDRHELVDSHADILEQNSMTVSLVDDDVINTIKKENDNIHIERDNFGSISERYSNGEYTLLNRDDEQYTALNESIDKNEYTYESEFKSLIRHLDIETFSETDNGDLQLILQESENTNAIEDIYGFDSINSVSVTLVITTEGLITEADIEILGNVNGIRDVRLINYSADDIGSTSISTPNWVTEAENSVTIVEGQYDISQGWILIEHQGLATIPEGTEIELINIDTNERDTVSLPDEFREGDRLGLSLLDDGEWAVTVNEIPPDGVGSNARGYRVIIPNTNVQDYFNINIRA